MFLRWCFCFVAFRQVNWQNFALYIGDRKIQLNQANDLEKLSAVGGQESLWRRRGGFQPRGENGKCETHRPPKLDSKNVHPKPLFRYAINDIDFTWG